MKKNIETPKSQKNLNTPKASAYLSQPRSVLDSLTKPIRQQNRQVTTSRSSLSVFKPTSPVSHSDFKSKTLSRPIGKYLTSVAVDQEVKKEIPVPGDETKISPRRTKAERNSMREKFSQDNMSLSSSQKIANVIAPHQINTRNW